MTKFCLSRNFSSENKISPCVIVSCAKRQKAPEIRALATREPASWRACGKITAAYLILYSKCQKGTHCSLLGPVQMIYLVVKHIYSPDRNLPSWAIRKQLSTDRLLDEGFIKNIRKKIYTKQMI